jgi:hypothetical protein
MQAYHSTEIANNELWNDERKADRGDWEETRKGNLSTNAEGVPTNADWLTRAPYFSSGCRRQATSSRDCYSHHSDTQHKGHSTAMRRVRAARLQRIALVFVLLGFLGTSRASLGDHLPEFRECVKVQISTLFTVQFVDSRFQVCIEENCDIGHASLRTSSVSGNRPSRTC